MVVLTPTMGISTVQAEPIADATIYRSGGVGLAEVRHGISSDWMGCDWDKPRLRCGLWPVGTVVTVNDVMKIHGDQAARGADLDFAVNVRHPAPPTWLQEALAHRLGDLGAYPWEEQETREVIADFHGCDASEIMLLNGVAEGFSLLPQIFGGGPATVAGGSASRRGDGVRAAVVHPSFTEPDIALTTANIPVTRVIRWSLVDGDWPGVVPADANLVVIGNPTNPTGVLHFREDIERALRPGRIVLVDEAFMDMSTSGPIDDADATDGVRSENQSANEGEYPESLVSHRPTGVVVARSLTKTFSVAGLRCGYFVGDADVIERLSHGRPPWSVGTLALEAMRQAVSPRGIEWSRHDKEEMVRNRAAMVEALTSAGWSVYPSAAPFMLVIPPERYAPASPESTRRLTQELAARSIAVRRTDTFPGLDGTALRLAVRPLRDVEQLIDVVQYIQNSRRA